MSNLSGPFHTFFHTSKFSMWTIKLNWVLQDYIPFWCQKLSSNLYFHFFFNAERLVKNCLIRWQKQQTYEVWDLKFPFSKIISICSHILWVFVNLVKKWQNFMEKLKFQKSLFQCVVQFMHNRCAKFQDVSNNGFWDFG